MNRHNTTRALNRSLTVKQLREQLENYDENAKVFFVCDYGDHSHTQQALPVINVEGFWSNNLEDTAYSQSEVALREESEDFEEDEGEGKEEVVEVVILQS
jgi:hypothetical protein